MCTCKKKYSCFFKHFSLLWLLMLLLLSDNLKNEIKCLRTFKKETKKMSSLRALFFGVIFSSFTLRTFKTAFSYLWQHKLIENFSYQLALKIVISSLLCGLRLLFGPDLKKKNYGMSEYEKTEHSKTESAKIEPIKTESTKTKSTKTKSTKTESMKTESTKTESMKTYSTKTESMMTIFMKTEKRKDNFRMI